MSYHSLIFDLDGTLTDPLTGIIRCMNYALSSHDHQVRSEQEIRPYIGPPLEVALGDLSGSTDHQDILCDLMRKSFDAAIYAAPPFAPRAMPF